MNKKRLINLLSIVAMLILTLIVIRQGHACVSEPVVLDVTKSMRVKIVDAGAPVYLTSETDLPEITSMMSGDGNALAAVKVEKEPAESKSSSENAPLFARANEKFKKYLGAKKLALSLDLTKLTQSKSPLEINLEVRIGKKQYRVVLVYSKLSPMDNLENKTRGCGTALIENI